MRALALLPATILLGATLPVVARFARASPEGSRFLGLFYAANIAGGVVGALLAAFYLLSAHDAYVATLAAVALNLAVAAAGTWLAARTARPGATKPAPSTRAGARWPIHVAIGLSGLAALAGEVLWTRNLSLLFGATAYAFALILAVFLLGLGAGAGAGAALARRVDAWTAFACTQLLACAAIVWAAYAIASALPYWPIDVTLPATAALEVQLDLLRTAFAVLPGAIAWGASFSLALAAAGGRRTAGALYAANTAGAVVGALGTSFVLVVALGSRGTQQVMLAAAACAACCCSSRRPRCGAGRPRCGSCSPRPSRASSARSRCSSALPPELVAYGRFLPTRGLGANVVHMGEGLSASIAVTREPDGTLTYHNAGKTQASTYPQDLRLQRMLGHWATLAAERPAAVS